MEIKHQCNDKVRYYSDQIEYKILDLLRLNPQGLRQREITKVMPKEPHNINIGNTLLFMLMDNLIVSSAGERFPKYFINPKRNFVFYDSPTITVQG